MLEIFYIDLVVDYKDVCVFIYVYKFIKLYV